MLAAVPLFILPPQAASTSINLRPTLDKTASAAIAISSAITFKPVPPPDFNKEVGSKLRAAQAKALADCDSQGGTLSLGSCVLPPPPSPPVIEAPVQPPGYYYGGEYLTGQIGYSLAGGNCVNTAKAYGKNQPGDPISWYTTTNQPFIGAAALFYFNHVAIVVGIWSNGDIEVAQENSAGAPHRYSQSEIRGYF